MTRPRSLARSGLGCAIAIALLAGSAAAPDASAVSQGQVDKFEGASTKGWVIHLPGGGSVAADTASRLAGNDLTQHVLDFPANVIDLGATDPSRRLFVADPVPGPPTSAAASTQAISLPGGGGWTIAVFPTTADALAAVAGPAASALSGLDELRIFHSLTSAFPGEVNVTQFCVGSPATAIPEPGTGLLLGLGLAALAARRRAA
jgi:hypothetical protein